MKTLCPFIVAFLLANTSHALVSDRFNCKLKVTDFESKVSSEQSQDFFVTRLPLSRSSAPNVRFTAGQTQSRLELGAPKAVLTANVNFYYKHAVKLDGAGKVIDARQVTCVAVSGGYCSKYGGGLNLCIDSQVACAENPEQDPFDLVNGWNPTSAFQGVPSFNDRGLGVVTSTIQDDFGKDVGAVQFECKFKGSVL